MQSKLELKIDNNNNKRKIMMMSRFISNPIILNAFEPIEYNWFTLYHSENVLNTVHLLLLARIGDYQPIYKLLKY